MRNWGTNVTSSGNIKVANMIKKTVLRPRQRNLANEYATMVAERQCPITLSEATIVELSVQRPKGRALSARGKFSQTNGSGIHSIGHVKICRGLLSAVESIQTSGMEITTAATANNR